MIIAVDFDGTCVKHRYPMVGEDVDGAVSVLKELVRKGHKIILYTMRSGDTDNMNLDPKEIEFYKPYIEAHNQTVEELRKENILNPQDDFKYELEFKNFFIPLQDCIERDSKRPNPIGEEVIRKTYEKYKDILKV